MIKDDEIDLTQHRDFRASGDNPTFVMINGRMYSDIAIFIDTVVRKRTYGAIPWNVNPLYKSYNYDGLVALGNKEERAGTINSHNWGTLYNIVCDCCGKEYKKIPWKIDFGICEECDNSMHNKTFPWQ